MYKVPANVGEGEGEGEGCVGDGAYGRVQDTKAGCDGMRWHGFRLEASCG